MKISRKLREIGSDTQLPALYIKENYHMDMNAITTLISSVGFPIAACIALFWYLTKQTDLHREEVDSLKSAIADLRVAIIQLTEKIDK